jgi:hypothetical protein
MFEKGTILEIGADRGADEWDRFESLGHQVLVCPGPGETRRCPLVEEGSCAMVDAADGVVFRLDLDDPYHRRVLGAYRSELGDATPLHVVVHPGQEVRHASLLEGAEISVGRMGAALEGFSSRVAMASAARGALADLADPTRHSVRHPAGRDR